MILTAELEVDELLAMETSEWTIAMINTDRREMGKHLAIPPPPLVDVVRSFVVSGWSVVHVQGVRVFRDGWPYKDLDLDPLPMRGGDTLTVTLTLTIDPR